MKDDSSSYRLTPAGFLIVQESEEARRTNAYYRAFGKYYGVDRLPPLVAADPELETLIGGPSVEDGRLQVTVNEWSNAHADQNAFITDIDVAIRLLNNFLSFGFRFELIYCQVARNQEEEGGLTGHAAVEGRTPALSFKYGFDVSWPSCRHSAILQPGVINENRDWRDKLNEWGLLDRYSDAVRLRQEYLAVYPYPPFDVYLVHKVALGSALQLRPS